MINNIYYFTPLVCPGLPWLLRGVGEAIWSGLPSGGGPRPHQELRGSGSKLKISARLQANIFTRRFLPKFE